MPELDILSLRQAVQENRYLIIEHAQQRMGLRKITHADVKHVVAAGDVVEQYPDNRPDPRALFMAEVGGEPLYVSAFSNPEMSLKSRFDSNAG